MKSQQGEPSRCLSRKLDEIDTHDPSLPAKAKSLDSFGARGEHQVLYLVTR